MPELPHMFRLGAACVAGFVTLSCLAVEQLTGRQFMEACAAYQNYGKVAGESVCRSYLQGYLSASDDVIPAEELPSPFMQRVLRTRVSGTTQSAFCLPEGVRLDDIIGKVLLLESAEVADDSSAGQLIERVLETHYRCDR